MGTPELAAVVLRRLLGWSRGQVVAVYTQPDRPAGRGHRLRPSPVKELALAEGLPVVQPLNCRSEAAVRALAALQPDVLVVAAYGLILPQAVLDIPRLAPVNVHTSLLPRYRGAAPIQRAIMENWQDDAESGVSIMRMEAGLDTGPVYAQRRIPLAGQTAGSLHDALADLGADALLEVLGDLLDGRAVPQAQDERLATYAAKVFKEDGYVDWDASLAQVHARIRGVTPFPGARTELEAACLGAPLVLQLQPGERETFAPGEAPACGSVRRDRRGLSIACRDGWYRLTRLRPPARQEMEAAALCNGMLRQAEQGIFGTARKPQVR